MNRTFVAALSLTFFALGCGDEPTPGATVVVTRGAPTPPEWLPPAATEVPLSGVSIELSLDTVDDLTRVTGRVRSSGDACVSLAPDARLVVSGVPLSLDEPGQGTWVFNERSSSPLATLITGQPGSAGWQRSCVAPRFSGSLSLAPSELVVSADEATWRWGEAGLPRFEVVSRAPHQLVLAWRGTGLPDAWHVGFLRDGQPIGLVEGGLEVTTTLSATSLSLVVTVPPALQGVPGRLQLSTEQRVSPGPATGLTLIMQTRTHFALE